MAGVHLVGVVTAGNERARVGLTVSRKVGGAVVRNRVKRWLREIVRHRYATLPTLDLVLIARPAAARAGLVALGEDLDGILRRLGGRR